MVFTRFCYWCLFVVLSLLSACSGSVNDEDLHGVWEYIRVENPNQGTVTPDEEIQENAPSIRFTEDSRLEMIWGGKILSQGTYRVTFPVIVYQEDLGKEGKREIKFLIKKFEDDVLVFQTTEADAVRVTARKLRGK